MKKAKIHISQLFGSNKIMKTDIINKLKDQLNKLKYIGIGFNTFRYRQQVLEINYNKGSLNQYKYYQTIWKF